MEHIDEDSVQPEGSEEDTLTRDAPEAVDDAADVSEGSPDGDTPADDAQDDQSDSLTDEQPEDSPDDQASDSEDSDEEPEDPADLRRRLEEMEKRYKGIRSAHDELSHKLKQFDRYQDVDLNEAVEVYKKKQAEVPVWDPRHERNQNFQRTLQLYDTYEQQIGSVPEDQRDAVAAAWNNTFTPDDVNDIRAYKQHEQAFARRLASNPREALRELMREESTDVVQSHARQQYVYQTATQIVQDPKNTAIVQAHYDEVLEASRQLDEAGVDPKELQTVIDRIRDREELAELRKKLVDRDRKAEQAQAQRDAAKGKARTGRDVSAARENTAESIYNAAKKKALDEGIPTSGPQFRTILREMEQALTS